MRICVTILLLILLSGCSMTVPDTVIDKPQPQQRRQLTLLLDKADKAIERGRFIAPQFDNANGYYRQVLVRWRLIGFEIIVCILLGLNRLSLARRYWPN
jgi:hypothetical protein